MLLGVVVYIQLRPRAKVTLPKHAAPVVFRTFTPRTLLPYNGRGPSSGKSSGGGDDDKNDKEPIYLAIKGQVYDVTPGQRFYGPQGPYANFAGRDASRGLALGSFDDDMLTVDLDGPLDTLSDLDEEQRAALNGWEESFREKYLLVGRLVAQASFVPEQEQEQEQQQQDQQDQQEQSTSDLDGFRENYRFTTQA